MNIKKGDVLKYKLNKNLKTKVLGIVDDLYFIQDPSSKVEASKYTYTLEGLKETFELPEEKWMPSHGVSFYYIDRDMTVTLSMKDWQNNSVYDNVPKANNCFPTKEAAEAKLAEVLKVLRESKEEADKEAREEADTLAVLKN